MSTNSDIRVLIAEDDFLIASLTRDELESIGMTVLGIATDGNMAVIMANELKPDVILMDITMPKQDGIAAAAALQESQPTPVVILSAHDEAELVARATAAGVGAFVVKPPQAAELERAIMIAIARHTDLMELRRLNQMLEQALAEVKTLRGIVPICSGCKKIRDDQNYWEEVDVYVTKHTHVQFSHGLCRTCLTKYFPLLADEIKD